MALPDFLRSLAFSQSKAALVKGGRKASASSICNRTYVRLYWKKRKGFRWTCFTVASRNKFPLKSSICPKKGEWTKRIVLPRKLDGGAVLAFDLSKGGIRRFRMDRIFAALPAAKANKRKFPSLIA